MQCWMNDPAIGGIDDKIKMVNILSTGVMEMLQFRDVFNYKLRVQN